MLGGQTIIDADCHVVEPAAVWGHYLEPRFRGRAARASGAGDADPAAAARRGALHMKQHDREPELAWRSAAAHVASLRRLGIDRAFLYPTHGRWLFALDSMEADLAGALVRAYNDWLLDFCDHAPGFLCPVGAMSQHDPADMVSELRRVAGLGWRAVFVRSNPIQGRLLGHPDHEPFWSECERLGVAVAIHEGAHARVPTAGASRSTTHFARHACSHPMGQMMAFLALVEGGVLERHPGLRVAFLEAGCGWLPCWLWRLDAEHEHLGGEVKRNVRRRPSEYFRRQCFVGCKPGEPYLPRIVERIGADNLLFGSEYPQIDPTTYPKIDHTKAAPGELLRTNTGIGPGVMGKILWDNPRRFYGLDSLTRC